jgi:flagellar protein FliO/FliZ
MARCRIALIVVSGCLNVALSAAPPDAGKSPAAALTSPNQSLSIEEARQPAEAGGVDSEKRDADQATSGEATVKESSSTAARPVPVRPPTFLGRKRASDEAEGPMAGAGQAPWYRNSYGALALVLALIALLYFGLKRWAPSMKVQDAGLVRVMGRTVVGPRQSLVLLRVGQRVVLVGVSPDRIDRVCEIADADEVASLTAQSSAGSSHGRFSSWLDREAAAFADTDKVNANERIGNEKRAGSKLSDLLEKLRTTKV